MHLAQPAYLLLLPLLALLSWWLRGRRRAAVPHPRLAMFAGLPLGRSRLARFGGRVLRGLALAALIVALAGPRWPDLRTRLDTEGIAIVLLVDVSGSMGERDFDAGGDLITRLDAVKRIFRIFVAGSPPGQRPHFEGRPADLLGLVAFATRPEATCPLTLEHATLLRLLDAQEPRVLPGESETNLSDALALGLARLRAAGNRRRVLVLLTDGEHNQSTTRSGWSPRQAARVAAGLGVPVYAIDAGKAPVGDDATADALATREGAVSTLEDIASITGGRYFAADDTPALVAACSEIDRLERDSIVSYQYRRYHEGYPWFAGAAFALFGLAGLLEQTLWRRLP
jgi:Ca-activated chloride channel homolog